MCLTHAKRIRPVTVLIILYQICLDEVDDCMALAEMDEPSNCKVLVLPVSGAPRSATQPIVCNERLGHWI